MSRPGGKIYKFFWLAVCLGLSGFVFETNKPILIADVQIVAPQRHPKRTIETSGKNEAFIDLAIIVRISKDGYAIGLRFADENVAIGRLKKPPRLLEISLGIHVDLESGWQSELRALGSWNHL